MGDHNDLPICKKEMQPRRLQKQSRPLEQLDEVIDNIRELMLWSAEIVSKERLSRRKEAATTAATSAGRWSR
jgi:hypothetical protein